MLEDLTGGPGRTQPPIGEYALIGDCRSAALVSRGGSIDWLCWPRFDSPSIFGALLDPSAGHWHLAPAGPFQVERAYLAGSNVLESRFTTPGGKMRLTDLMTVASEADKRVMLLPDHQILRRVVCEAGDVDIEMELVPRPDYARRVPRIRAAGALGVRVETSQGLLTLLTDRPGTIANDGAVRARVHLRAGETFDLSLGFASDWPAILPPIKQTAEIALARSLAWWRQWSDRLEYQGPCREAVLRSALALRLLVYAPSGAVIAAPTTSLPERPGGDLNWDYRFCWLRDAAFTARALFGLGFAEEAEAFVSWLLHATRLSRPELRVLYDVFGNRPRRERVLDHLAGYRDARPVRVGNAAADQLQLDVYGEVIDATAQLVRMGGTLDRDVQNMLRDFGHYVCRHWRQPDDGIWEPRTGRAHNTHSRVLCWTALDRLIELHRGGHIRRLPVDEFARERAAIRSEVETRGWNSALGSYVSCLDGDEVDASLLLLAWYGFEPASSARMKSTYALIRQRLGASDLLYRYRGAVSPGEGAFGISSFWAAEFLALGGGQAGDAQRLLERLVKRGNDVGLFGEEVDPDSGQQLGNFPQAFTHVGLINAALRLSERVAREDTTARPKPSGTIELEEKGARV